MGSRDYYFQILVVNRQGYINELKEIFENKLDIHEMDSEQQTNYLHIALQNATQTTPPIETIQFYLDHHLDVNLQDIVGNTPLHYALVHGNIACALLLLKAGANPNLVNQEGFCPLSMLQEINHLDSRLTLLQAMLAQGGDVTAKAPNALSIAASYAFKTQTDPSFEAVVAAIEQHTQTIMPAAHTTPSTTTPIMAATVANLASTSAAVAPTKPTTLPSQIESEIHFRVQENILVSTDIVQHIMAQFHLDETVLTRVQNTVREQRQALIAAQKKWPSMTDCEKLLLAFYALFKQGIIALPAACTNTDGSHAQIHAFQTRYQGDKTFQGFCFFSSEDIRHVLAHRELPLTLGTIASPSHDSSTQSISKIIAEQLKAQGLHVSQDKHANQTITIKDFTWRNRSDFHVFKTKYLI